MYTCTIYMLFKGDKVGSTGRVLSSPASYMRVACCYMTILFNRTVKKYFNTALNYTELEQHSLYYCMHECIESIMEEGMCI